jgi:4-aminobutyrate aminotransferase
MLGYIGAFHGRTYGALSFPASKPVQRERFFPLVLGVTHIPYPYCYRCAFKQKLPDCDYWCIDFIEEILFKKYVPANEIAGILFEPIQGEGGYIVPPPGYFKRLKKLADKYDLLLIDDEVQAGFARTGKWFAIEHWNVEPDIVCIAKGVASGLPLGIMVAKSDIMDWVPGAHGSTFGGNPISCAASMATIEVINEEKLLENALKQGEYIMKRFREFSEKHEIIGDIRGKGLMIGIELVKDQRTKEPAEEAAKDVIIRSWKKGVAIIAAEVSTLRIAPPLIINRELIDIALSIVEESIKEAEKACVRN